MNSNRSRNATQPHNRGSIYVAILGATVLVTLLGLSSLLASRLTYQRSSVVSSVNHASALAESAVELALRRIDANDDWRTLFTHDQWTPTRDLGTGQICFKLVDLEDADLNNDDTDGVRIVGKGQVNNAVRIVSVDAEIQTVSNTLLTNGDLETGDTTGWYVNTGTASNSIQTAGPAEGDYYLKTSSRIFKEYGPIQIVTDDIVNGQSYQISAYVKMSNSAENVIYNFQITSTLGGISWWYVDAGRAETSWTTITAIMSPTWSGTLISAYWWISTKDSTQDFMTDEAVVYPLGQTPKKAIRIVPSTWQRVVE